MFQALFTAVSISMPRLPEITLLRTRNAGHATEQEVNPPQASIQHDPILRSPVKTAM
jgi:hypothetical protein